MVRSPLPQACVQEKIPRRWNHKNSEVSHFSKRPKCKRNMSLITETEDNYTYGLGELTQISDSICHAAYAQKEADAGERRAMF